MEMKNSMQKYGRFLFGVHCNKYIIFYTFYLPFSYYCLRLFHFFSLQTYWPITHQGKILEFF